MAESINTEVDPKELEAARGMWHNFTTLIKYSGVGVALVLILLLTLVYYPK